MERFFCEDLTDSKVFLGQEESHHLIRVHRKRVGEVVHLFDGKGCIAKGEISVMENSKVVILILERVDQPIEKRITLAVSPLKMEDRFEWMLEKATEIGIAEFLPILCERTENKRFRKERYEKIVLGAAKQSLKSFLPIIHHPMPLKSAFQSRNDSVYFGHCHPSFPTKELKNILLKDASSLVIGPEGDLSENEIQWLLNLEATPISLGKERLRTETAAIVASTLSLI